MRRLLSRLIRKTAAFTGGVPKPGCAEDGVGAPGIDQGRRSPAD
jgi:hypothetical protein